MHKFKVILAALLSALTISAMTTVAVAAVSDDEYVYGTMNIPYSEFYKNEGIGYEVDAVASATSSKWKNENLVAGTYHQENEDGTGVILGVTYNVAVKKSDLANISEKYNFVESDTMPNAYKIVSVNGENLEFSAVVGNTTELSGEAAISTSKPWGDYLVDVTGAEVEGTIYGVIFTTTTGDNFAMRHLENIWRGEFAWSAGFTTKEPHGNTLNYEDFQALSGQTVDKITYITENGYYVVDVNIYVPIKFEYNLSVENTTIDNGTTSLLLEGLPSDYNAVYSIDSLDAVIKNNSITYSNAKPGQYTLNITDANGKYADISTTFIISTDNIPVKYESGKIIASDGISKEEFTNYINNISKVTVNDKSYNATGKGSVKIILDDGTIDTTANSRGELIFEEGNIYKITVSANGYSNDITFEFSTMVEDEKGNSVEPPKDDKTPDNNTTSDTVPTGDTSNNLLPISMLATVTLCTAGIAIKKKKSN